MVTLGVCLILLAGCSIGGDSAEEEAGGNDQVGREVDDSAEVEPLDSDGETVEPDDGSAPEGGQGETTTGDDDLDSDDAAGNDPEGDSEPDGAGGADGESGGSIDRGPDLESYTPVPEDSTGDRLLILEDDGRLTSFDPDREEEVELRPARLGPQPRQPTWSPDGRFVAWAEVNRNGGATVVVSTADGVSQRGFATRSIPFFFSWSPAMDGTLALLANTNNATQLALDRINVFEDGGEDPASGDGLTLFEGGPLFSTWEGSGSRLAAHVGRTEISIVDPETGENQGPMIPGSPGLVTPVWLDSGAIAIVAPEAVDTGEPGTEEMPATIALAEVAEVAENDDTDVGRVANLRHLVAAPDGSWLVAEADQQSLLVQPPLRVAVANRDPEVQQVNDATAPPPAVLTRQAEELETLGPNLSRLDLATGELSEVIDESPVAFFANPVDRHTLALLSPRAPDRISPEWVVIDEGGNIIVSFPLIPNEHFVQNYLPFFDQYAQTTAYWSVDGQRFVVVGAEPDGVSGVWMVGIDGTTNRLRDGISASWRPGPRPAEGGGEGVV